MATPNTFPAPIGVTLSYSDLRAGTTTVNFQLEGGTYTLAFEARNENEPGVLTLNDSRGNAVVTMRTPGYAFFQVSPIGGAYNIAATAHVRRVSITKELK